MSQLIQYKCDGCGRLKGDTNHWSRMRIGTALHLYPWNFYGEGGDEPESADCKVLHLCGAGCIQNMVSKFSAGEFSAGEAV